MRQPTYPSRAVISLLGVSILVLIADLVIIFGPGGHPGLARLLGFVGCIGVLCSVWVNHKQTASLT